MPRAAALRDHRSPKRTKVGRKIAKLRREGKPQKQAVAIALDMKRRKKL